MSRPDRRPARPLAAARSRPRTALSVVLALLLAATTAASATAESVSITASVQVASVAVSVELTVSAASVRVGDTLKATATVANVGTGRASNVTVTLRADAAGLQVRGSDTTTLSQLQPGHAKSATWSLCARQTGNYVLLARVTVDGASVDSPAVVLAVTGQRKKAC